MTIVAKVTQKLKKPPSLAALPDFSLDIMLAFGTTYSVIRESLDRLFEQGGGSLLFPSISLVPGGNAFNLGRIAAAIGVDSNFVGKTSPLGKTLIEHYNESRQLKLHLDTSGELAATIIMESEYQGRLSNVMFPFPGSVSSFKSSDLSDNQWEILRRCNAIAITNMENQEFPGLVKDVVTRVPPSALISIDFSDLSPHISRLDEVFEMLESDGSPSLVVGNEAEFAYLNGHLTGRTSFPTLGATPRAISERIPDIEFALHTWYEASLWKDGACIAKAPSLDLNPQRVTGAGDAWHAGFLTAKLCELNPLESLQFAHLVAGCYITETNLESINDVNLFAKRARSR